MACTGVYASADAFASFWCIENLLKGTHDGVGPVDAALLDNTASFVTLGVQAGVDMILYNVTAGTSGPVTARTEETITATGVTWNAGDTYNITLIDGVERANIDHWLDVAAGDIHAALASIGACDCNLATWATRQNGWLWKLNIIDAAAYHQCPCGQPHMTDAMRERYLTWAGDQFEMIMSGKLDPCDGATGSQYPVIGWAEQSVTEFAAADIIVNDIQRNAE